MKSKSVPGWIVLAFALTISIHLLASLATALTIGLMRGVTDFADQVRLYDRGVLPYYNGISFPAITALSAFYLWPVIAYFRTGAAAPPSLTVQRRTVGAPLFLAALSFTGYVFGAVLFPLLTVWRFGHWSTDLMSQHVLAPLVNGFLASTSTYFVLDWIFRARALPSVFPGGRRISVPGALSLGVRGRLFAFLVAIAFTPLFTMLGLVRAAAARAKAGHPIDAVVPALATASTITFVAYVCLGIALTLLVARLLTRPLGEMAAALRRVEAGDLGVEVQVASTDEVGVLEAGVNEMVSALREKERILQTFGRIVDPTVRDRLLAGGLRLGGELRTASVLLCDLRGFTAFAERTPPEVVVATLNEFFTVMTQWVRECGGFVDKFIGDAMLVVFGLFDDEETNRSDSAAAALRCALGIRNRLDELNRRRAASRQPLLAISGGLHTGEVLAGTIGAEHRHEYTVVGDTVNVAARLQELSKERGVDLLVSEAAYELALSRGFTGKVQMRDTVTLRGRREAIPVVSLV